MPRVQAAAAYWIARARAEPADSAVHPGARWMRYHAWSRRQLQAWTLDQVRADRPRYRRCVDLGCGPGDWAALFAPLCDELFACEVSPDFVEQARARTRSHPAREITCADLRDYELPPGADLVFAGGVLMYLPDDDVRAVLARIRTAAAPGAHVIVRDWCVCNLGRRGVTTATGYSVHRRARELRAMAEAQGLRTLEVRSSPSIYADRWARRVPALALPARAAWRLGTLHWRRASYTLRFRV